MNYIIVKNAHPFVQAMFWDEDPQNGIDISWSAVDTYTGQQVGIQKSYATKGGAEIDCQKMQKYNPCGYYAVCPVAV
jgi:hypothetical protein